MRQYFQYSGITEQHGGFLTSSVLAMATILTVASAGLAQDASTVTLKYDDGEGITGELVEATEDVVHLRTTIGLITIPLEGVTCIGLACPESKRFVSTLPPVTLSSRDGSVKIAGNLIETTDDEYVLATDFGELRLDLDEAICEGDGCPNVPNQTALDDNVVLSDGATQIEGKLVGFEETAYVVEVEALGTIRVNSELFACNGEICPK